jgi:hypothetical protein
MSSWSALLRIASPREALILLALQFLPLRIEAQRV